MLRASCTVAGALGRVPATALAHSPAQGGQARALGSSTTPSAAALSLFINTQRTSAAPGASTSSAHDRAGAALRPPMTPSQKAGGTRRSLWSCGAAGRAAPTATLVASVPPTLNWFITPHCNYSCRFCFATFQDIPREAALSELQRMTAVLSEVQRMGFTRVTFVGGEPLLHPHCDALIHAAKRDFGLGTCLVTNGSLLTERRLRSLAGSLDVVAFSVDASEGWMHAELGRGLPHEVLGGGAAPEDGGGAGRNAHVERVLGLCEVARDVGMTLKVNTVVTKVNLHDDGGMAALVRRMAPARWKIFQALPVDGQNTGSIEPLLITRKQFDVYAARARAALEGSSTSVVVESNSEMRGTYAMMDALGRFFSNTRPLTEGPAGGGSACAPGHTYGPSLLNVGGEAAWAAVAPDFDAGGFLDRGGVWHYGQDEDTFRRELSQARANANAANAATP